MQTSMQSSVSPVRILIAEDSPTQAQRLQYILQQQGYDIAMAANGRIALELVEKFKPILIISDVNMPEIDGYELARRVKAYPHSHNIPVILVTTMSDPQDVILGLECGADTFVLKPYDEQYLLGRVRYVLANLEMHRDHDVGMGVEIYFHNRKHFITADRLQILNLLLSTYDAAMQSNKELKHSKETLEKRSAEVDAANRAKSIFLATMSHEIRTPMNGVLGMLELLSLTKLDAEQRKSLGIVRESGKSLLRIIDDILDFSKIEAGKLDIRPEVASLKEVVQSVQNIYSGVASSKGLMIRRSVDPQISPAVLVDSMRLRQILNNFVSNAIKFTPKGGSIEIIAELIERADGEDRVRFAVKDTGIGISTENQQRLFQPFSQADGDTARRFGGTGLGLTICRRLADLMGGAVEIVSELGKGTTINLTVSLPIADAKDLPVVDVDSTLKLMHSTTRMRRMAPSAEVAEAERTLVLLVDDHPTNRVVLSSQVRTLGYAVQSAADGNEALELWKSGRFSLVITDCNMPEMDGYELARSIRGLETGNDSNRTPIIACTANAMDGDAEICFAAGMDDYLVKPVELSELLKKLDQWLPIPRQSSKSPATPVRLVEDPPATAPIDRSVLAGISGGDAATEREILIDFRRLNDEDAAMLKRGVTTSNNPQVIRATHRIKGASTMIGALGLARVCEHIEHASRVNDWTSIKASMATFQDEWMRLNAYLDGE